MTGRVVKIQTKTQLRKIFGDHCSRLRTLRNAKVISLNFIAENYCI